MRIPILLLLLLLPASGFAAGLTMKSAQLDAFVNTDGSVRMDYTFELFNGGDVAYGSFPLSLPTSKYDVQSIRAYRCDASATSQTEQGAQIEEESPMGRPLPVQAETEELNTIDLTINLSDEPLMPGDSARLCIIVPLPNYVQEDWECPGTAYVSVRPTIFYSDPPVVDLFVAIHLPEDLDPGTVLAQQEWPQEEIQVSLPVQEENGHPVVRWTAKKKIHDIYWICALFPAKGIPLRAKFDGLQTSIRMVPKETMSADVYIQEDGLVKVVYEAEVENIGCKSMESVQFVLTGNPVSVTAKQDGNAIPIEVYPDILDPMERYLGGGWTMPYNAMLKPTIPPGERVSLRVEALLENEIELMKGVEPTARVSFGLTASANGYWQPGSQWTTRIHLPAGIEATQVTPQSADFPQKKVVDGHTSLLWTQTKAPEPVQVVFPLGKIERVEWSAEKPDHWIFVLKRIQNYPKIQALIGIVGFFLCLAVMKRFVRRK